MQTRCSFLEWNPGAGSRRSLALSSLEQLHLSQELTDFLVQARQVRVHNTFVPEKSLPEKSQYDWDNLRTVLINCPSIVRQLSDVYPSQMVPILSE